MADELRAKRPFLMGLSLASARKSALATTEALYKLCGHNTGNLAFHHAIDSHLGGLPAMPWSSSVAALEQAGDLGVVAAANQLGPQADHRLLGAKFAELDLPLVTIGLGAQGSVSGELPTVPPGSLAWVKSLADHAPAACPNIGVRGAFTLRLLEHHGLADRATVLGCPTLFINSDPALGEKIAARRREPRRIAVTAGHQGWKHLRNLEASLAHLVTASHGAYIGQSALEMIRLTRGEADELTEPELTACRDYVAPHMTLPDFSTWSRRHGQVFFDIPSWMEFYRHFDFVVGVRIHGVMLALQAGVPALCIAHDSRTLELCETMLVPHVRATDVRAGIRADQLLALSEFDPVAFDSNRRQLARRYVDFLVGNGLSPAAWLGALGSSAD